MAITVSDPTHQAANERDRRLGERIDAFIAEGERLRAELAKQQAEFDLDAAASANWRLEDLYASCPRVILPGLRRSTTYLKGNYWDADESDLSEEELDDLYLLDLIVIGQRGRGPDARPVRYGIEISYTIDQGDVMRAARRTELLRRAGIDATAAVAGRSISPRIRELAHENGVEVLLEIPDDV